MTCGKDAHGGIGLFGLRCVVAIVVLCDCRFEGFLIGHVANDDRDFAFRAVNLE